MPEDNPKNTPDKLTDGDVKMGWNALGASKPGGREDPSAYLEWEDPQTVKTIYLYDIPEGGNYIKKLEIIFNDDPSAKIIVEDGVPDGGMKVVTLPEAKSGVEKIEFHILEAQAQYKNYGFAEIKVFSAEPGKVPVNSISFGAPGVTLFPEGTYTMKPPVAVPGSATDTGVCVYVEEGSDVIRLEANITDGIIKSYTIHALKLGKAVIRARAENGVTADFTVTVGSREQLEDKIIEAEGLFGRYPGSTPAHEALRMVINEAVDIYNTSRDLGEYTKAVEELEEAIKVFLETASNGKTAQEIADDMVMVPPSRGQAVLEKPNIPLGYKVSVKNASPEGIIGKNWSIAIPDEDRSAEITLLVTKISDNTTGEKTFNITIPGYSPEDVLDTVEIPQPLKKENKLVFPEMPWGFSISIARSTDNIIAEDGIISLPLEDMDVTASVRVTKSLNGSYKEKDMVFTIPGIGKPLGTQIQADDIDQLKGASIRIEDNQVMNFNAGDWIRYDNVDFGEEEKEIQASLNLAVHPDWAGKRIRILLDQPDGEELGVITVTAAPEGGDWGVYYMHQTNLNQKLSGVHSIYLVGTPDDKGRTEGIGSVKELLFEETAPVHTITVQEGIENGTVTADKTEAKKGETVTLSVSANDGWCLTEGSLKVNDGRVEMADNKFLMPDENVTITAGFEKIQKYSVRISEDMANGMVTADKSEAAEGEEVTLTVSAGDGYYYVDDSLKANDGRIPVKDGKFIMPAEDVMITASFSRQMPEIFEVRIDPMENGSIWASPMSGTATTLILLRIMPDEGYQMAEGSLLVNGGAVAVSEDYSFILPQENVTVQAVFEKVPGQPDTPQPPEDKPQPPEDTPRLPDKTPQSPNGGSGSFGKKPQSPGSSGDEKKASGKKNTNDSSKNSASRPVLKEDSSISGWDQINKMLGTLKDGENVTVQMKDSWILPGKTLEVIKGRDAVLTAEAGEGFLWSVKGTDVTGKSLRDINLKASWENNIIPDEVMLLYTGAEKPRQLRLAHEGEFCAVMTLHVKLEQKQAGSYANLFYYNKETQNLEYITSSLIDENGAASLDLTHASDYLVIVEEAAMDENSLSKTVKIPVSGINLGKESIELEIGGSVGLEAYVLPLDAWDTALKYSCADESIAVVDDEGMITAVSAGETVITISSGDGSFTAECRITVKEPAKEAASETVQETQGKENNPSAMSVIGIGALLLVGILVIVVRKKYSRK